MGEKSERWAFERIRELEREQKRLRDRLWKVTLSRNVWRERANDPKLSGRWRKTVKR